mgnify:CR=1 FL=1
MPLLTSFIDGRYIPERANAERFETKIGRAHV